MANTIKGLTVEIGGDTTKLGKALEDVNKKSSNLSKELGEINKLLKLDPGNTDLLKQKMTVLGEAINNTKEKLKTLKEAEKQAQEQFAKGEISEEQYRALQREIAGTEQKLDGYESALKDTEKATKNTKEHTGKFAAALAEAAQAAAKVAVEVAKVAAVTVTAASTAAVALGKLVVESYADYEQLVGGVETLFGVGGQSLQEYAEAQGKAVSEVQDEWMAMTTGQRIVLNNAEEAYRTAGLSANEYIETVTSFSASLIQSLGDDTAKAAKYADMAITDMSDNANKMGSDMASIQNAYQGFAKQNYTMLDNLNTIGVLVA